MEFNAQHCPPDMLHLKKGIISKLITQVVDWTIAQRREEDLLAEMKRHKIPFVYVFRIRELDLILCFKNPCYLFVNNYIFNNTCLQFIARLYQEERSDGSSSSVKWTCQTFTI